jgi:dihydrolipoamide dehydrogenase
MPKPVGEANGMVERFDLIVVGTGSGLDVASGLAGRGWKVAIIERDAIGGTCLNRGCIPSKMLLHSADVVETIRSAGLFGVDVKGYRIDFRSIIERVTKHVDGESRQIREALQGTDNPRLFEANCRFVGEKTLRVGEETIQADKILIASGGRPRIPDIPGLRETGFLTSDEALRLTDQPEVLTILGGGYIAAELAHFFGALGTRVQIVQRRDTLVPNEDREVSAKYTEIARTKYEVYTGFEASRVSKKGKDVELLIRDVKAGTSKTLRADRLLVAAGRTPNSDGLDVGQTGLRVDAQGFLRTDEFLETNVKGIFALGDAVGHFLFKHSANLEAQFSYWNLVDSADKTAVDYTAMPHAIFASPQIAGVGKTEEELHKEGVPYAVGRYNYIDTGMGIALEDRTGFVKILAHRETHKILGCHILGTDASTLLHEVVIAMKSGDGSLRNITRAVHVHPALSEVVQRAAYAVSA